MQLSSAGALRASSRGANVPSRLTPMGLISCCLYIRRERQGEMGRQTGRQTDGGDKEKIGCPKMYEKKREANCAQNMPDRHTKMPSLSTLPPLKKPSCCVAHLSVLLHPAGAQEPLEQFNYRISAPSNLLKDTAGPSILIQLHLHRVSLASFKMIYQRIIQ